MSSKKEYHHFKESMKCFFEKEYPADQITVSEEGFLEHKRGTEEFPSVNLKQLFEKTDGKVNVYEVAGKILGLYREKVWIQNSSEDIVFIALNRERNLQLMEKYVFCDRGNVILLFGKMDGKKFLPLLSGEYEDKEYLLKIAVRNMRKKYPCRCVRLEDYVRENNEKNIMTEKNIYVLCCLDGDFPYTSTVLYYSGKEMRELTEQNGTDYYVFQCTQELTLLCPENEISRNEAEEIAAGITEHIPEVLNTDVQIFKHGKLEYLEPCV